MHEVLTFAIEQRIESTVAGPGKKRIQRHDSSEKLQRESAAQSG
jgi:hypothetical protein